MATARRRALLRGATVSAVTQKGGKTGSQRDGRAAHGAARVGDGGAESPFFRGVEPERRVRMRPAAMGDIAAR
jgi:hypothetical protein